MAIATITDVHCHHEQRVQHAVDQSIDVRKHRRRDCGRVAGHVDGVGLVECATVGLLREVAAGARGHAAGEPEIHDADTARGDRGGDEEKGDWQEQLDGFRESARLGKGSDPR